MASELVTSGVCPNFVETHQVFRMSGAPVASMWGTPTCQQPQGSLDTFMLSMLPLLKASGAGGTGGSASTASGVSGGPGRHLGSEPVLPLVSSHSGPQAWDFEAAHTGPALGGTPGVEVGVETSPPHAPALAPAAAGGAAGGAGHAGPDPAPGRQPIPVPVSYAVPPLPSLGDSVFICMELCDGDAEAYLRGLELRVQAWEHAGANSSTSADAAPGSFLAPGVFLAGRTGAVVPVAAAPADGSVDASSAGVGMGAGAGAGEDALLATPSDDPGLGVVLPSDDPGLGVVLPWFFQMAMSLLACQAHLGVIHGDVKLLNFFVVGRCGLVCMRCCFPMHVCSVHWFARP
jgi:hypothetical protein